MTQPNLAEPGRRPHRRLAGRTLFLIALAAVAVAGGVAFGLEVTIKREARPLPGLDIMAAAPASDTRAPVGPTVVVPGLWTVELTECEAEDAADAPRPTPAR